MPGHLFAEYFLTEGIRATDEWRASVSDAAAFDAFRDGVRQRYDALSRSADPNEAVTEQELIRPVLELLGWADYLPQQGAARNEDIPDLLLFPDAASKERAAARGNAQARYRDAIVVEESKRLGLALDARDSEDGRRSRTPHGQILRYLSTAEVESESRIRWGLLTGGGVWRLYDYRARPRATGYFEADLGSMLEPGGEDHLRLFYLLFRRESFILQEGATTTFLDDALLEGRRYDEKVAQDLSSVVFERVFPKLVEALAAASGEELPRVREAALIFLYRLLFVLYAEDRGLLPVNDSRYDDYGLRKRLREDIARRTWMAPSSSTSASKYYDHLTTLCRLIDKGDESIGLPPYNGGLFASEAAPLLEGVRLPDATVAPIIYDLSHAEADGERRFVNYRDMSVQQLGSIYERLLEREPVRDDTGKIVIRPNVYARKDSGSFFTPQELVDLIVDRTLKPLAEERRAAFKEKSKELKSDRRPKAERLRGAAQAGPGRGGARPQGAGPGNGERPLPGHRRRLPVGLHRRACRVHARRPRLARRRVRVSAGGTRSGDQARHPTAGRGVGLGDGRVAAHRPGDHQADGAEAVHLRRGQEPADRGAGEGVAVAAQLHRRRAAVVPRPPPALRRLSDRHEGTRQHRGARRLSGLFASSAIQAAENATGGMQRIEEMSDADVAEVRESAALFRGVEDMTAEMRGLLDFLCGLRWLTAGMTKKARSEFESPLVDFLEQNSQNAYRLLALGPSGMDASAADFGALWSDARALADRERFLHWEAAFPGVWHGWQDVRPQGGFDAVIGNPPWDRIKLQEVEWFATRSTKLALAPTAAERRTGIRRLRQRGDPLADQFDAAKDQADSLGQLIRASGDYPLLGGGDINLYSLFVERAMGLIKPDGFVGLLTPSGIYADKTAARFFKSVSTSGRLSGLFDFENRKIFFKDVHASFKFCALIFGGEERRFDEAECAFFLHDTRTINDPDRCFSLDPSDFALVNPNTCTAPVFRTRRDAEITRGIYERHPVLVDRSGSGERRVWPVRYVRMLDMANDSHLFKTAAQLEAEGFYPVQGNRWKKGGELYVSLYEGKMVQAFDHRAASITNREGNLFRPGQPDRTLEGEHRDPSFSPRPRYWVSQQASAATEAFDWFLAFKDITASTNVRTMIAAIVPQVGCGHTLPVLLPSEGQWDVESTACFLANFNSFGFDYVTRQKVPATHLTWYTIEQLPVIPVSDYDRQIGSTTARDLVRDHVLRLTYTAHDMEPFARDLGYDGPPFRWDEEERRHLRARLDALYFHLYGLSREDADYVLGTFPIVRRQDEKEFGSYRTRDLVLAYMSALAAGDTETVVAL